MISAVIFEWIFIWVCPQCVLLPLIAWSCILNPALVEPLYGVLWSLKRHPSFTIWISKTRVKLEETRSTQILISFQAKFRLILCRRTLLILKRKLKDKKITASLVYICQIIFSVNWDFSFKGFSSLSKLYRRWKLSGGKVYEVWEKF